ncbi:hypothetical protein ARHIZOSPH14_28480 [Agromyces rhizosphaerae]|uniref:Uncharacterized protein n=1 Tax=Agromyces rhizosphaerae TaxID=88374 RepID=A0A9W6FQI7_9MICO|nr:hypothetical protein ARHIZOSPH14_28480 [Agromyces rhizosphaerae]
MQDVVRPGHQVAQRTVQLGPGLVGERQLRLFRHGTSAVMPAGYHRCRVEALPQCVGRTARAPTSSGANL